MTNTTERVQRFLDSCAARGHLSPTLREIADGVGLKSTNTASYHVRKLVAAGCVEQDAGGRIQLQRESIATFKVRVIESAGRTALLEISSQGLGILRTDGIYTVEVRHAE